MRIRRFLPMFLLAAAAALPAHANELAPLLAQLGAAPPSALTPAAMPEAIAPKSASLTDISDVWWTATESGWGLQLVQNETTVFATVYLYAADGRPSHYTATLFYAGSHVWAGDLYEATGPWFGAPGFNPGQVARRRVGTMRFDLVSLSTATLRYDVDGVNVAKTVSRLGFVNENYTGVYGGVINRDERRLHAVVSERELHRAGHRLPHHADRRRHHRPGSDGRGRELHLHRSLRAARQARIRGRHLHLHERRGRHHFDARHAGAAVGHRAARHREQQLLPDGDR